MPGSLPPAMDQPSLVAFILADVAPRQRALLRPGVEAAVDGIFRSRGNPRVVLTPIAINLAKVRELRSATR